MSEYSKGRQSSRRLLGQPSGQWSLLEEDMAAAAAGQLDLAKPSTPLYIRELKEQVKVGLLAAWCLLLAHPCMNEMTPTS